MCLKILIRESWPDRRGILRENALATVEESDGVISLEPRIDGAPNDSVARGREILTSALNPCDEQGSYRPRQGRPTSEASTLVRAPRRSTGLWDTVRSLTPSSRHLQRGSTSCCTLLSR